MKKFLLSILGLALGVGAFAADYQLGEVLDPRTLTEGEHQVIFRFATKSTFGFMRATQDGTTSNVFFGNKHTDSSLDQIFDETFIYTINVTIDENEQRNFTIKNYLGGYAPHTTTNDVNTKYYSTTTDEENAGSFSALYCITTEGYQDSHYMLQLNGTNLQVHFNEFWTYYGTGDGGKADAGGLAGAGNNTRTAAAFQMYASERVVADIEQVTNATLNEAITDGAVIALQCLDSSGGRYSYFNGDQLKTTTSQYSNLFKVVSTNNGFYLQQLSSGKFVGGTSLVELKDSQDEANVFTVSVPTSFGSCKWPTEAVAGQNTIRFTTGSNFLNTAEPHNVPKYANGTGGFSAWFVFTYSDKAVSDLGKALLSGMITDSVKEDTPGFISPDENLSALIAKVESEEVMTVEEINAGVANFANYEANIAGPFTGIYTITNIDGTGSRGYLCHVEMQSDYVWSSGKAITDVTLPEIDNDYSKWAFVEIDGSTFLFNVGAKMFIYPTGTEGNTPWRFSASQAENIELAPSSLGIGIVEINSTISDVTYHMSIINDNEQPVGGQYAESDGGISFVFERVGDLSEDLKSEMVAKDPTAIEEITVDTEKAQGIYDLQGRRLNAPVKGINIINGKKVLVK